MKTKVRNFEDNAWADYCVNHPSMHIAQTCLKNVTPYQFWRLADNYPDLESRMHIQIRLMGNSGLNGGVPWHVGTNGSFCLIYKQGTEDVTHFLLDCPFFKKNVDFVWLNIKARITEINPLDGTQIFAISSAILSGITMFCCYSGVCHCHSVTRRQFLSKDLFRQQSENL